ncbi:MAG: hypothetical protein NVS1B6_11290 [Steroidobacteraceae bacterium]
MHCQVDQHTFVRRLAGKETKTAEVCCGLATYKVQLPLICVGALSQRPAQAFKSETPNNV